jgi:hypothetical protein
VYGVVPPEGFAVNVIDWLMSIVGLEGVMAPADKVGLTVIRSALVVDELSGVLASSATVVQ